MPYLLERASVRRRQRTWRAAIALLSVGAATACSAAEKHKTEASLQRPDGGGDAARGLAYARNACASCHAVEGGHLTSPHPAAPSFQSLAERQDLSRIGLAVLMQTSHQDMPDLIVKSDEIADLWAYLSALQDN